MTCNILLPLHVGAVLLMACRCAATHYCVSPPQCGAWVSCMMQLQRAPQHCDGDDDVCDCIEWLAVLAAAVPSTSRVFVSQLLAVGLDDCACAITVRRLTYIYIDACQSITCCCGIDMLL